MSGERLLYQLHFLYCTSALKRTFHGAVMWLDLGEDTCHANGTSERETVNYVNAVCVCEMLTLPFWRMKPSVYTEESH